MDNERELGRIISWKARLDATLEFADSVAPVFEAMHREAHATLRGYADWLNARDHKNENGRVWRAETVSRIFAIDVRARTSATRIHDRDIARRRFLGLDAREAEETKAAYIARAERLAERLRGPWRPVVDRTKDFPAV